MALMLRERAHTRDRGLESVQNRDTLCAATPCSALTAPMFWKTGLPPGLSRSRGCRRLVGREHAPPGGGP
jgi:hypothetical protein